MKYQLSTNGSKEKKKQKSLRDGDYVAMFFQQHLQRRKKSVTETI